MWSVAVLSNPPLWFWQVLVAVIGLSLGLVVGAWRRRRARLRDAQRRKSRSPRSRQAASSEASVGVSTLLGQVGASASASQFPEGDGTPQGRLLEHLRRNNLELAAKLKASAAQHARLVKDKDDEVATLKDDYDQRVEALRQTHSQELKHLMTLLVEQVDGIHKAHANHVKALEAEIERARSLSRPGTGAPASNAAPPPEERATTMFASTEPLPSPGEAL